MIQILGIRSFRDKNDKEKKYDAFFDKGWGAESVQDLFANLESIIEKIPAKERYNLYYTACDCVPGEKRKLQAQHIIPFDIDGIDVDKKEAYIPPILEALGIEFEKTGIIYSGNGLQFIIGINEPITDEDFFDEYRLHYKALCDDINRALKKENLAGKADSSVFSTARLLRLPGTKNIKPKKPTRDAEFIQRVVDKIDFDLKKRANLPLVKQEDSLPTEVLDKLPPPDTESVLKECNFLQWCSTHPAEVTEPVWYAMLSVTARLDNGAQLSHKMSEGHPGYDKAETDDKIKQALDASGPRRCSNIDSLWSGCHKCAHHGKIKSPWLIRGPDFIRTESTGFRNIAMDKNGNPKPGQPAYEDLRKYFQKDHPYINRSDSAITFVWKKSQWSEFHKPEIINYAYQKIENPKPNRNQRNEFESLISCTNLRSSDWFVESTQNKMNFENGTLSTKTMEFNEHTLDNGFRYTLPYEYAPDATCPKFIKFMDDITCNDESLKMLLLEFAGFAFANHNCNPAKALILSGEGSNGKSTFINILQALAGKDNYSSLTLKDLLFDTNRYQLDGKLFNIAEETPDKSLNDSSLFKNLVSGGEVMVKMLYHQPFKIRNRAKLIMACNRLPRTNDITKGLLRRMLIVPFNAEFEGKADDKQMEDKLKIELPGILNEILRAYKRFVGNNETFTESAGVNEAVNSYRAEIDATYSWWNESIKDHGYDPDVDRQAHKVSLQRMYGNYTIWCDTHGVKEPGDFVTFCKRIRKYIHPLHADKRLIRFNEGGKKITALIGVEMDHYEDF